MPEILNMLVLSTGHISWATAEILNKDPMTWPVSGGTSPYGWFLYAHDEVDDSCPEDLAAAYVFARSHGCSYIHFDCDGPTVEELPSYAW